MDDKSYSETRANSETAPTPPTGALIVAATGTTDANKFTGCYFVVTGTGTNTAWTLYNKGGHQIDSGTGNPSGFSFNHDKQNPNNPNSADINWTTSNCTWTPTNGAITEIAGSWNNNDTSVKRGPQSGSFTASSGGAIDPVTASASASAK